MKKETFYIRYLITRILFIRILNRSEFLTDLKSSKSLNQGFVNWLIQSFGAITIQDLINLYDMTKAKIITSSRNQPEMLRVWNALEKDSKVVWGKHERCVSHSIYQKMIAELFGE